MSTTVKQVQKRKLQLLERYRSARLEEMLLVTRQQALEEAERNRFPWKGEFRAKEDIALLYGERRKWDRRFLMDTIVLTVVLCGIVIAGSMLVKVVSPKPSQTREFLMEQGNQGAAPAETPGETSADESAQG